MVRVGRQAAMRMVDDPVVVLSGRRRGVDMDDDVLQLRQVVQELMPGLDGDCVGLSNTGFWAHRNVHFPI